MSEELKEIFKLIDAMFESCDKDYQELANQKMDECYFEDHANVRLVNSFLFGFSKLQGKIGAKLFRKVLFELREIDDFSTPMIDLLHDLERLKIIDSTETWDELREIRNLLSHEYPLETPERIETLHLVLEGYEKMKTIYQQIKKIVT